MLNKLFFIFILLLLNNPLFSSDILTHYRINGIDNVEKQMDLDLTKEDYWKNYLQDKVTSFGYIESYSNILTCNKSKSILTLYMKNKDQTFRVQKIYSAYTGKIKGDKHREGDLKTPIGIYNITKKISKVDSFYGPMAFVTSYPNVYDIYQGKNGSGIWIHGLPTEQERDEFTKGCIAINNKSIECLDRNINIDETLLIINKEKIIQNISKESLSIVLSQLYAWRYSWLYNDIEAYLSFYSNDFRRFDHMNMDRFTKYKTRIFKKQEKKTIIFNDINVIPYPNLTDTYRVSFKEIYKSNSFSFIGNKILILKLENNKIKILTEK